MKIKTKNRTTVINIGSPVLNCFGAIQVHKQKGKAVIRQEIEKLAENSNY